MFQLLGAAICSSLSSPSPSSLSGSSETVWLNTHTQFWLCPLNEWIRGIWHESVCVVHTVECCLCLRTECHSWPAGMSCIPQCTQQGHTWFCTHVKSHDLQYLLILCSICSLDPSSTKNMKHVQTKHVRQQHHTLFVLILWHAKTWLCVLVK